MPLWYHRQHDMIFSKEMGTQDSQNLDY